MPGKKKPPPPTSPVADTPDPVPGPLAYEWRVSLAHRWFPRPAERAGPDHADAHDASDRDDAS